MTNQISPRKSTSSQLSLIPEESYKTMPSSSKSCESLYSNTSSSRSAHLIYSRKTPPGFNARQPTIIPASNDVRQRVLSARRLRMKNFQNQLADAQQTIADLSHENRMLRTVHKRQDSALAKYESTNAELPQLLHSHSEELRVWQTKYRNLQAINKDFEQKLKQKELIILTLSDQNKYYNQLNRDKNLEERQHLTDKLQSLEMQIKEKDNDMKLMARRMQLEAKNFKQQLQNEQKKTKDALTKLEKARLELSGYHKLDEISLLEKLPMGNLRRKTVMEECPKLEKNFEKLLQSDQAIADDADYQDSQRSTTTRTMRRAKEPGDVDAALLNERNKTLEKQHQQELLKQLSSPDYEEDFENGDLDGVEIAGDEKEEHEIKNDTNETINTDTEGPNETVEEDEDEQDESDVIINSAKESRQEDISQIRKKISNEYKEREAFLDTFCRQATVVTYEDPKIRSNPKVQTRPRSRKNKLLAALKAIDDSKSQD